MNKISSKSPATTSDNIAQAPLLGDEQAVECILTDLRVVIDKIDKNFNSAKKLILIFAEALFDTKQYEQSQICRKIKESLKDKITEGKITKKWIEECLPKDYKRKYSKSEPSSLSKPASITPTILQEKHEKDDFEGQTLSSVTSFKTNQGKANPFTDDQLDQPSIRSETRTSYPESQHDKRFEEALFSENSELREALKRQTVFTSADHIPANEIRFKISKDKYEQLKLAMENSKDSIYLVFDKGGVLERAQADVLSAGLLNERS